jgi:hypothetical protein
MNTVTSSPQGIAGEVSQVEIHFFWLVDVSGSMSGNKIQTVNYAINEVLPQIRDIENDESVKILMRTIIFGDEADWHGGEEPVEASKFTWTDLNAKLGNFTATAQQSMWHDTGQREFGNYFGKWLHEEWKRLVIWHQSTTNHHPTNTGMNDSGKTFEPYGTTIAALLAFEGVIFDPSVVGSQTDSLSSPYAHYVWDTRTLMQGDLGMILLCTDGFSDSLKDPEGSLKDMYNKVKTHGIDWLKDILPQEMFRWSDKGVRDDITVIACFFQA